MSRVAQQIASSLTHLSEVLPKSVCSLHTSVVLFSRAAAYQNLRPAPPTVFPAIHIWTSPTPTACLDHCQLLYSVECCPWQRILPGPALSPGTFYCPSPMFYEMVCLVSGCSSSVPCLQFSCSNQMCSAKNGWLPIN